MAKDTLLLRSNIDIRVHVRDWKRPNARDRIAYYKLMRSRRSLISFRVSQV